MSDSKSGFASVAKFGIFGCLGCGGFIVLMLIGFTIWYFSVNNRDATLRAAIAAEQDNSKIQYDEMWKSIMEIAEVPEKYKEDFKESWAVIVNGNATQQKSAISAFVTRYNPNFDSKLYGKLMTVIEHRRKEFTNAQKKLRDVKRQHDEFRTKMPVNSQFGRMLFGTFAEVEVQLVLSDKTEKAFDTGKDERVDVFGKKEKADAEKKAKEEADAKKEKDGKKD